MPANPKYLDSNRWQHFAKVSAATLGGYGLSLILHYTLAVYSNEKLVVATFEYSLFVFWILFLLFPFFFKNGWCCWLLYLGVAGICLLLLTNHDLILSV